MLNLVLLSTVTIAAAQLVVQPQHRNNTNESPRSIPVDITSLLNNRGFGKDIGDANFDGSNSMVKAQSNNCSKLTILEVATLLNFCRQQH